MERKEVMAIKKSLQFCASIEYRIKTLQYEMENFSNEFYRNNSLIGTAQLYTELDLYQKTMPVEYAALKIVSNERALKHKIERLTDFKERLEERIPVPLETLKRMAKRHYLTDLEVQSYQCLEQLEEELEEERMLKRQKQIRERAKIAYKEKNRG